MNKKLTKLLSMALAIGMVGSTMAACGGGGGDSDSEQTLDIYLLYKGYGDSWLTSAIEEFKKEAWVQAAYPELAINYTFDSVDATAFQKITAGASINKYDLLFGVNLQGYEDRGLIADLTDSVYLAEVPGETGKKVIDKIPDRVLSKVRRANAPARADGEDTYHVVSYIDGMFGMYYNADLLEQMQLPVPLTTEQFMEVGAQIKSKTYTSSIKSGEKTVIMNNANDNYWNTSFSVWWAQYEGVEGLENYYEGYDVAEAKYGSRTVLDQEGRLESLTVIDKILTDYSYESSLSTDYKKAQTAFLSGQGVFHYNGDYFASEMQLEMEALKADNINYDIKYMRMPVISSIVEKLELYTHGTADFNSLSAAEKSAYDAKLRSIIQAVDEDKTFAQANLAGISENDFNTVAAARCIMGWRAANSQAAVVPSYAAAKGLAADFLRYMYTDKMIKNFTKVSKGTLFPSTYDILNDQEVMASVSSIEKSKMDLLKGTSNYSFTSMPVPSATSLGKAGLDAIYFNGTFEVMAVQTTNKMSPADILAAEKEHWNQNAWDQMVSSSSLNK
jgi:hypothetical protein